MIGAVGKGHVGGSMSIADAMAVLYGKVMRYDPANPNWELRDRLVFSKGHSGPALYAALTIKGFFPNEWLASMNQVGSNLPSHVHARLTPGVDASTGSLGQGLSVAVGMALADQLDRRDTYVFCVMGAGECQEGQVWEAAMFAGNHILNHLVVLVDSNKRQCSGELKDINDLGNLGRKFNDFGFDVLEVNGHDVAQIEMAIRKAKGSHIRPTVIILDTIKGKGCSFAEQMKDNHNIPAGPQQVSTAVEVLEARIHKLNEMRGRSREN